MGAPLTIGNALLVIAVGAVVAVVALHLLAYLLAWLAGRAKNFNL